MWRDGELSLAYLTVDGASAIEHVEAAAAAGFPAAGLRIMPPVHLPARGAVAADPEVIRRVRAACDRLNVRPLDAEVASLAARTASDNLEMLVDAAAEMGFRFVQTVIEDTDMSRAGENLALLADFARGAGIGVALEFMAFRPLRDLESALALIEQSGSDNVGVLLDALHLARSGGSPASVAAIPAGRIAMAQLCDAPLNAPEFAALATEARSGRLHPGEGELWLDDFLDALPDGLPLSLEVPHPSFTGMSAVERACRSMHELTAFLNSRAKRC